MCNQLALLSVLLQAHVPSASISCEFGHTSAHLQCHLDHYVAKFVHVELPNRSMNQDSVFDRF